LHVCVHQQALREALHQAACKGAVDVMQKLADEGAKLSGAPRSLTLIHLLVLQSDVISQQQLSGY
jgi:hypothetical protein